MKHKFLSILIKVSRYTTASLLVIIGLLGIGIVSYNPLNITNTYLPINIGTFTLTQVFLQTNLDIFYADPYIWGGTLAGSIIALFMSLLLFSDNPKQLLKTLIHSPIVIYRKLKVGRDKLFKLVTYLNEESAKWRMAFNVLKSPYSLLRAAGLSPQMAIGLIMAGGTVGGGVVVNETVLADRSFRNGDAGVYAAPTDAPSAKLEEMLAFRKENKDDNTLRIVLGVVPVREIKIENVSVGTVYANSALPSSTAHTSANGTAATSTAILIGGTVVSSGTSTYLEIGEMILEKSRCSQLYFDNTTAHTINVVGNASDGQSINQSPGTSRMRAIGGGHHQAEAMVTSGGSYDRIHIDAPTSSTNGKIGKLILSNLYTEGGACVFDRMKIGTLTIELNEIGIANGFSTKEFKIHQSVTASNWNVSDNVEVSIGTPSETLSNE
tara:strand:- start:850 stop:2160 length:1311 start_codon:yes stop_codon:yes gene_type:complete